MPATLLSKTCDCDTRSLLAAMNIAVGVVPKRSAKPVLASVLMTVDPEQGSCLVATDLEYGVKVRLIGARADKAFRVLLNPNRALPILQRAESDSVEFSLTDDRLIVKGRGFKFELTTDDPDTYPALPETPAGGRHELAAADLRRMVRMTRFAADPGSTRYALSGCLLETSPGGGDGAGRLAMVATDGRRLARLECPCVVTGGGGFAGAGKTSVLPLKILALLERSLDDDDPPVKVHCDQNSVTAEADRLTVWGRLVEGRFPDYTQAYPPPPRSRVTVKSGVLLGRVSLASVANSEESRGVAFTLADGCLALKSSAADVGSGDVAVPLDYDGPALDWSLDHRYVTDALAAVGPDVNLELRVVDGKTAVEFADAEWRYVMMPLTSGD